MANFNAAVEKARHVLGLMQLLNDSRLTRDADGQWQFSGRLNKSEQAEIASELLYDEDLMECRGLQPLLWQMARHLDGRNPVWQADWFATCDALAYELAALPMVEARVHDALDAALDAMSEQPA